MRDKIAIKIFRMTRDCFTKFEAICNTNINKDYSSYFATDISDLADDLACDLKAMYKKEGRQAIIKFPRDTYEIVCRMSEPELYEPISEGEIKVFWEKFSKATK